MHNILRKISKIIFNNIYPSTCIGCDSVLDKYDKKDGVCLSCKRKIKMVGSNTCYKCGTPIKSTVSEYCDDCKRKKHSFNQCKSVFQYIGPMKKSMYRFKYGNRRSYGETYAHFALEKYGAWIRSNNIEVIIPVPMYKPKVKKRGYNQAEVFADALGRFSGIPVEKRIISRKKNTAPMKQLNSVQRVKNLQNAFKLSDNDVKFRKVLVVDDIYTTGTTIDEISKNLALIGITEVYGLCVCTGESS
ncbi:MAG: ComF family protein [Pseudobutyrivibrio sp.]|nr:ComF family protein [Pseudobutyrivibrio sp.]